MQLPFVLQSAETMKAAVAYLEPFMERTSDNRQKGTIVLATVKGDVHDIGKNLVDIMLTNNGYRVVNLGIKQPLSSILDAAASASSAHAVGMSGLLVKSTVVMRENLEEMSAARHRLAGDPGRRRADAPLCRRGLHRGLCHRPRRLCARRLRGPGADGEGGRRLLRRGSSATSRERDKNKPAERAAANWARPPMRARCGRSMSRKSACAAPS